MNTRDFAKFLDKINNQIDEFNYESAKEFLTKERLSVASIARQARIIQAAFDDLERMVIAKRSNEV